MTLGTGIGVTLAGQANGVEGNGVAAIVGSFLGTFTLLYTIVGNPALGDPRLFLPLLLVTPAAFAVIGYNLGAKMKDTGKPASLPWTLDLPVLSLEW